MRFKSSKILYAYWDELRGRRIAPRRFEIEPSRIADILPETFILEKIGSKEIRFRLAGTRVCDRLGGQFRGTNFYSCWGNDCRARVERGLTRVFEQGAVLVIDVEAQYADGVSSQYEFVIFPLMHTNRTIDRFMGIISSGTAHKVCECNGERPSLNVKDTYLHWPINPDIRSDEKEHEDPGIFDGHIRHARIVRHERRSFRVYEGGLSQHTKSDG